MRIVRHLLSAVVWLGLTIPFAHAERRMALVIGNGLYPNLPASQLLPKAVNDANAVGDALETLGFEVIRGQNLSRSEMEANLVKLSGQLHQGDTVLFFYTGHGATINGQNYLLPSSVPAVASPEHQLAAHDALSEAQIRSDLKASGAELAILVVDACRKSPFAQPGRGDLGDFACGSSPPAANSPGVFTLYSAAPGQEALDRLGADDSDPNSVFVRKLAPVLKRQGRDLVEIARRDGGGVVTLAQRGGLAEMGQEVGEEVAALAHSAGDVQTPAYQDQLAIEAERQADEPISPKAAARRESTPEADLDAPPDEEKAKLTARTRDDRMSSLRLTLAPYLKKPSPRIILAPEVRRTEADIRAASVGGEVLAASSSKKGKSAASPGGKRKHAAAKRRKPSTSPARRRKGGR